uniref:Leukocyte elastase inhibitor n=1 Tax=Callorhinchus milii TaxID=7868 RepID=A0A4W3K618_CALMI|eukprot:gi/632937991/ref/XP_007901848.1/ PREDICTED: leukocyte elastase inhibitor-like [Callorhinchus milii]
MDPLCVANTNFALDLYKKVIEGKEKENVFFSPLSISAALAMVYLGAGGDTAAQMGKVLHFDTADDVHTRFKTLMSDINKPGTSYLLKLANSLYRDKGYTILQEFLSSTTEFYQAALSAVDFANQPDVARKNINSWVETKTEGKISNLLSPGTITDLTKLVLVNAVYFKGSWEQKFQENDTYKKPFRLSKSKSKTVNMMYQEGYFYIAYISELQTSIVELPYYENELSMVILLPDDINDNSTGLEKLEEVLTCEKLLNWTKWENMKQKKVKIHLPKFKLEDQFDLKSTLSAMGMADAFNNSKADFSGMTETNDLVLSKVVHKSFVEVNEEGTEAAAATGIIITTRSLTPEIVADHPFLFFIRHNKTKNILFFGRFSLPEGKDVNGEEENFFQFFLNNFCTIL